MPRPQIVDAVFARSPQGAPVPLDPPSVSRPKIARTGRPETPASLSAIYGRSDLRAELEWVQEERKRLEEYTLGQFDLIQKQLALLKQEREALLAQRSGLIKNQAIRQQKLNRQMKLLTARTAALQQREKAITEREAALPSHSEEVDKIKNELQTLRQERDQLQATLETQQTLLGQVRVEAQNLEQAAQNVRAELAALEEAVGNRKETWAAEQADFQGQRIQLDDRYLALEKSEEALHRRMAELDKLEARLRREEGVSPEALGSPNWKARYDELQEKLAENEAQVQGLKTAEQALARRTAELDELEARLRQEADRQKTSSQELEVQQTEIRARQCEVEERARTVAQAEQALTQRAEALSELETRLHQQADSQSGALGENQAEHAEMLALRAQLDDRCGSIAEAEQALVERQARLAEWEERLRSEADTRAQLSTTLEWEGQQAGFLAEQAQLEARSSTLEKAEHELARRAAELEGLEALLRRELERSKQQMAVKCRENDMLRAKLKLRAMTQCA